MVKKDLDIRPVGLFFKNYDYTDSVGTDTSPGGSIYHGPMDKFKSVKEFLEKSRKKKRKKKLAELINRIATDKTDTEITDLSLYKNKKEREKLNNLDSFLELMDKETLLSGNTVDIDTMYQARKKAGFPKIPNNAPVWMHLMINAIDTENPKERHAKYTRNLGAFDKDFYASEIEKEKKQFIADAQRGWLRYEEFNDWKLNYPLLTNTIYFKENEFKKGAKEYLERKFEKEQLKQKLLNIVPRDVDLSLLPNGTKLYCTESAQKIFGVKQFTKKDGSWFSDGNRYGVEEASENFIMRLIGYNGIDYFTVLFQPESELNKIKTPTEEEIISTIKHFLRNEPEKFLEPYLWVYEITISDAYEEVYGSDYFDK